MDNQHTTEFDISLGRRLREARIMRGHSQRDLGEFAGVSYQQIQKNEKGQSRISAERLHRISRHLKMPIEFFFEGNDGDTRYDSIHSAETLHLAAHIDELPDDLIRSNVRRLVASIHQAWERQNTKDN
ncbi:MAG: helix-turn-helix domain-containing protein [Alphaproteobacteria bacterium]